MREDFLHFLWKYQYFNTSTLEGTNGEKIHVVKQGFQNEDSGPDFSFSSINIDGINWNGHVEIHLSTSDWYLHKHQNDRAYENVVLHVVWEHDIKKKAIPTEYTLELKGYVNQELVRKYKNIKNSVDELPCFKSWDSSLQIRLFQMLSVAFLDRFDEKSSEIKMKYLEGDDWQKIVYQRLLVSFGFKLNSEPFYELALKLPFKILMKHSNDIVQLEALLFGVAGFLESPVDEYSKKLKKEYQFLSKKYSLQSLNKYEWKFSKTRVHNFPTVRIAQIASIINTFPRLNDLIEEGSVEQIHGFFSNLKVSDYWVEHYDFGKLYKKGFVRLGESSISILMINFISLLRFSKGKLKNNDELKESACNLLEGLHPENNKFSRKFDVLNIKFKSALETQGALHLYQNYCLKRKCLSCKVGSGILKSD